MRGNVLLILTSWGHNSSDISDNESRNPPPWKIEKNQFKTVKGIWHYKFSLSNLKELS
jgi:hypothetical protein